jgi:hypothetical protein
MRDFATAHVGIGSGVDNTNELANIRLTPESGQRQTF